MTRAEIIRMALKAGFVGKPFCRLGAYSNDLERFAALVEQHLIASGYRKCAVGQRTTQFCGQLEQAVLAEREACAKQVEPKGPRPCECVSCDGLEFCGSIKVSAVEEWDSKTECAAAIRARGEK